MWNPGEFDYLITSANKKKSVMEEKSVPVPHLVSKTTVKRALALAG